MASEIPLMLRGTIQRWRGDQLPGPGQVATPAPVAAQEVVVVGGWIRPVRLGDPFLPAAQLKGPILGRATSDARGSFQITLTPPPAVPTDVTVFLAVCGGYYLNRFSASGDFAAMNWPEQLDQPLLLVDDREAAR